VDVCARQIVGFDTAKPEDYTACGRVDIQEDLVDWKEQLRNKAISLLADPRVAGLLQDPRVTRGIVSAFKLRSNVEKRVEAGIRVVARRLHLASESEVQELRRAVARLERQIEQARLEDAEILADSRALS
jgi:hypothetical protein